MKSIKFLFVIIALMSTRVSGQIINVIPQPSAVEVAAGSISLPSRTSIFYHNDFHNEAEFLQQVLLHEHKISAKLQLHDGKRFTKGNFYLINEGAVQPDSGREAYSLTTGSGYVAIQSSGSAGIFYGIQTLRQIIQDSDGSQQLPKLTIRDKPRFGWRGFMLDEARYFKGAIEVKRILDQMAYLKMNVFHWHLTDDTGWRIEIKKYPKLTEIGSTRKESEMGTWLSDKMDGKVHSGFYTQEEIRELVRYAAARHITIIPEIEMPGHASAAIASYPWLGARNEQIEVPTKFRIQLNVFNVANPKVIEFLHDVLKEMMDLFPSDIVHIGGDEVKYDQWKESIEVQEYMAKNSISTPADLQINFTNGISNYLDKNGHRMMGWNEILGGHHANNDSVDTQVRQTLSRNVIIHFWAGDPAIAKRAAEKGYDVINSHGEFTYLDYDYGTTSLEKAYSFDPVPKTLPAEFHPRILGFGCQMWGEWIPTVESMNELIYPRIAAFAETGWSPAGQKDFAKFTRALNENIKKHWQRNGIVLLPEFR